MICAKFRYGFGVDVPPSFEEFYARERQMGMGMGAGMGQHNASLGFPEGRYLWVSNPHWGEFSFFFFFLCCMRGDSKMKVGESRSGVE